MGILTKRIAVLPGDGIGPEVCNEAIRVLEAVAERFGHKFEFEKYLMGACAIDATGNPLPDETVDACLEADAILLGAIGDPKYDNDPSAKERAGNTALEEVVMILRQHPYLNLDTNVNTKLLAETSAMVSHMMRMPVQPNKAIVGSNAFSHSSGIHQDGVIKHRETYEIIDPRDVGVADSSIVLTARSGRAALAYRLQKIGYNFDKNTLDKAYASFLQVADRTKEVVDHDLHILVGQENLVAAS